MEHRGRPFTCCACQTREASLNALVLQKEQHAQAQQLSAAVAQERQQRQQLEGTVAALQWQVQQLLSGATLINGNNGASQPGTATAVHAAEAAHTAVSKEQ